jgi:hypothetical protein
LLEAAFVEVRKLATKRRKLAIRRRSA